MLTALAAEGPTLDAVPAERFGRAPYFVLVEDGNLVEAIPNQEAQGSSGVGGGFPRAKLPRCRRRRESR